MSEGIGIILKLSVCFSLLPFRAYGFSLLKAFICCWGMGWRVLPGGMQRKRKHSASDIQKQSL